MPAFKKLFLVDDDADDRMFFAEVIQQIDRGIQLNTSVNAMEAKQYLETTDQLPELIFLDYNMPVMNGLEYLLWLKKQLRFREIPVVMFTTSGEHREKCYDAGADWYIVKPNTAKELFNQLNALLTEGFGPLKLASEN
jgi:CheY-like chemotaxis protein